VTTRLAIAVIGLAALAAATGSDTPDPSRTRDVPVDSLVSRSGIPGGRDRLSDELPPTQRVQVTVEARVTLDTRTGVYTYSYRLTNDSNSRNNLDFFAIAPIASRDAIEAPEHWGSFEYAFEDSGTAAVWAVVDVGSLPTGYVDTGNVPPSEFELRPGRSVEGFRIRSRSAPGREPARFFATGFDTIPAGEPGDQDEQPDLFQRAVTGVTLGPGR